MGIMPGLTLFLLIKIAFFYKFIAFAELNIKVKLIKK